MTLVSHSAEQRVEFSRLFRMGLPTKETISMHCKAFEANCHPTTGISGSHLDVLVDAVWNDETARAAVLSANAEIARIVEAEFVELYGRGNGDVSVVRGRDIRIFVKGSELVMSTITTERFPIVTFVSNDNRVRLDLPLYPIAMTCISLRRLEESIDINGADDASSSASDDGYAECETIAIQQVGDKSRQHQHISELANDIADVELNLAKTLERLHARAK
jgi:hypothetical protein